MSKHIYLPKVIAGAVTVRVQPGQRWAFVKFVETYRRHHWHDEPGHDYSHIVLPKRPATVSGFLEIHCYNDTEYIGVLKTSTPRQMDLFLRGKKVRFK